MRDAKENREKNGPVSHFLNREKEKYGPVSHFFFAVFFRVTHDGLSERAGGTTHSLSRDILNVSENTLKVTVTRYAEELTEEARCMTFADSRLQTTFRQK